MRSLLGTSASLLATATMHHRSSWCVPSVGAGSLNPALVLVNAPTLTTEQLLPVTRLWESGAFSSVVCADGGANRLYDALSSDPERRAKLIPQFIVGDLDSVRDDVCDFYRKHNTAIMQDPNQDNNDLEKCLLFIEGQDLTPRPEVIVFGAFSGRFDQQMAAFHCLYRFQNSPRLSKIVLVGDGNLAFLLQPNIEHSISLTEKEGPGCGLLPIGGRVDSVTTSGLKWNLSNQPLEFGHLVSTSNEVVREREDNSVLVTCSHPLIWVVQVSL